MNEKIDFVLTWVDGDDPEWKKEKNKYSDATGDENRYRDWGTLKYWFRGIEKYASWVNRIHFVTCGHLPNWLNVDHPKLNVVKHSDYIPKEYLPTFSSHPIELNFHRIADLTERFVYFNDDMFIINPVKVEDFFVNDLPCDMGVLYPLSANPVSVEFDHIMLNCSEVFLRNFDFENVYKKDYYKWVNVKYGKHLIKTMLMRRFPCFSQIMMTHQPSSIMKQTMIEVWEKEGLLLDEVCKNRFRSKNDINQYIFRYWSLGKGEFFPYNIINRGSYVEVGRSELNYDRIILKEKKKLLCLNDVSMDIDYNMESKRMTKAFEIKFPQKSAFEI